VIFVPKYVSRVVFKGGILGGAHQFWGNPYLNSTTVLFDKTHNLTKGSILPESVPILTYQPIANSRPILSHPINLCIIIVIINPLRNDVIIASAPPR